MTRCDLEDYEREKAQFAQDIETGSMTSEIWRRGTKPQSIDRWDEGQFGDDPPGADSCTEAAEHDGSSIETVQEWKNMANKAFVELLLDLIRRESAS